MAEEKTNKKKEENPPKKGEISKTSERKNQAVVNAKDLRISTKHAVAICDFIRGKSIEKAVYNLTQVLSFKKAVPMKGEIPHRKGKGIMSGRYPSKAVKEFIKELRELGANALNNGLEIEKCRIECKANLASRPYRRFGETRGKRTHLTLKLVPTKERK